MYLGWVTQEAFGSRLRLERERRGLTLRAISDSTKIKESLLAGLERGDVSNWPGGLFRRAYLRDYASAIGLPTEPLVEEFVRLFPDDTESMTLFDDPPAPEAGAERPAASRPRRQRREAGDLDRVRVAMFDFGVVVLLASSLAFVAGANVALALGILAPGYLILTTALLGRSGGAWLFSRGGEAPATARPAAVTARPAAAPSPEPAADPNAEPASRPRLALDERPRRAS